MESYKVSPCNIRYQGIRTRSVVIDELISSDFIGIYIIVFIYQILEILFWGGRNRKTRWIMVTKQSYCFVPFNFWNGFLCCIYCTKLEPISKIGSWISLTTARSARVPHRKNVPCISDLAGVKFLLKKERTFFCGALPSMNRAGDGASMRTRFCQNYFLGKRIWQNLGWFPARRRGLGRNPRGLGFRVFWRAKIQKLSN